jgi:SAM-dependent methyltransferase
MKIRDSGMPDAALWESFFEPALVLRRLAFVSGSQEVADLGCGYGTFAIAAAQLTAGRVHAFDIEKEMVDATNTRARRLGLSNVSAVERDFVAEGTGLSDASVGYVMLFNILHAEDAVSLVRETFRILEPQGVLGVIHWIHDAGTPRGPDLSIRPRPEQCIAWASEIGFVLKDPQASLPPYHYGLVFRKPG